MDFSKIKDLFRIKKKEPADFSLDLPDLPDFDKMEFDENQNMDMSSMPSMEDEKSDDLNFPEMPELPDFDRAKPILRSSSMPFNYPSRQSSVSKVINQEKSAVFVSVEDFSHAVDTIKDAKKLSKKMDSDLTTMVESERNKEKQFSEVHKVLEDVNKKLMFIDKTLFEGGG
ncbi:MAG: hypothetical protein Q8O89_03710 [Nanoarchaeota archaeon]|nr:hypothetical protein [Nanoarchaeota archaeon]